MNEQQLHSLLTAMWKDYLNLNPEAERIHRMFSKMNPYIHNDHIALRTFNLPTIDLNVLARPFIEAGYQARGEYHFPGKNLYAQHFEHTDEELPKIFISQLLTETLTIENEEIINRLVRQVPLSKLQSDHLSYAGRLWSLDYTTYQQLLAESEYAAWVAAFGFRPNHFTILVNDLESHHNIEEVNQYLIANGFQLNEAGGQVKGEPADCLQQSSTLANPVEVKFIDQKRYIPGCYYEFALRYPMADGKLYQGFVTSSADKIFQSTDSR